MTEAAPEVAGIYCRLSVARFGDTTKVDAQERICRKLAAERGWRIAAVPGYPDSDNHGVWKDNNKSAWRIGVKRRGWEAMLAAVEAGQIRNLVVYHGDRMVRQPYDLEVLIRLAGRGMTIISPTGTRRFDIPEDVAVLGILANMARLESENNSRRKRDGFARMASEGIAPVAGGRWKRGFGYDSRGRTQIPGEADAIRKAARRVLEGELLTTIAADLGVTSVSGKPLTWYTLQRILLRPRIAGLLADGTPGSWEPILDRDTWEMTRATLTARAISRPAAENQRYLLSGIAQCAYCGEKMQRHSTGRAGHVTTGYGCVTPGCRKVHRNMVLLDRYVTGAVVTRLAHPGVTAAVDEVRADPVGMEIAQLEARKAEARATIETLADHPGADLALLATSIASFDQKIGALRDRAQESARARILRTHAGITRAEFEALPLDVRRALIRACYTVIVLRALRRGPGFSEEDVVLDPL